MYSVFLDLSVRACYIAYSMHLKRLVCVLMESELGIVESNSNLDLAVNGLDTSLDAVSLPVM